MPNRAGKTYAPESTPVLRSIRDDPSLILDRLTDGFLTIDTDWRLCFVNQAVETRTGQLRGDLIGRSIWDVLKETAGTEFEQQLKSAYETQTPRQFEYYYRVWDRWFENRVYPADDGVSLLITDISGKKRAAARLKAEHAVTRILAQADSLEEAVPPILEAISECLHADVAEFWRPHAASETLALEEFFPKALSPLMQDFVEAGIELKLAKGEGFPGGVWAKGEARCGMISEPQKNQKHFARFLIAQRAGINSAIAFPIFTGKEIQGVMVFFSSREIKPSASLMNMLSAIGGDIGLFILRHRAEQALLKSEQNLRRRAKELEAANQELESFSYSVSHDLRSPLRAMDMALDMLEEDCGEAIGELGRSYLEHFRVSTRKMNELIEGLLRFGRLGRVAIAKETINMTSLARGVWEEMSLQESERHISFHLGELPPAEADETLVRQIFSNLLSNALKYSRPRERTVIEVGSTMRGGAVAYYVRDNGVGFDARYSGKLFRVFQRLHPEEKFEGAGIGLAMVGRIVQRHGGSVWAESPDDGGATFYFTLSQSSWDEFSPAK